MKRTLIAILVVLGLSAAHLWADGYTPGAHNEESYGELDIFDLIMGIIENPDPIPQCHWIPLTVDPSSPEAQRTGHRDDGRPAFEFDRDTQGPFLTWAYDAGGDHDIAFNRWRKNDWRRKIDFVTSSTVDEVDPRLYVDDYNDVYLTWWEDDPGSRIMAAKKYGSRWSSPIHVGTGRRPSVAIWDGGLVVTYERDNPNGPGQQIVFSHYSMGTLGSFVPPQIVALTQRTKRLDPILHVRAGVMWIDWKSADDVIAVSRYQNGVWQAPTSENWTAASWAGELTVRHLIELEMTN
jgi:hypothetical protein